jgi:hypothetical protein
MTCPLKGYAKRALVASTGACLAARLNLGALREVLAKARDVLVVDILHLIHAESAYLAPGDVAVTTTAAAAGTAPAAGTTPAATRPEATAATTGAISTAPAATGAIAAPAATTAGTVTTATAFRAAFAFGTAFARRATLAGRPTRSLRGGCLWRIYIAIAVAVACTVPGGSSVFSSILICHFQSSFLAHRFTPAAR